MKYVVEYQAGNGKVGTRAFNNFEKFEQFACNIRKEGGVIYKVKKV